MKFDYSKEPGRSLLPREAVSFDNPLVSVITPFYNAGKYFGQTFNCMMNQTFPWFEWIIVDDGSTNADDVEILHATVLRDNRIHFFRQENGGTVKAFKKSIAKSNAEIIIFLASDGLIENQFIEYLHWALMRNPSASWAYTDQVGFHNAQYLCQKEFSSTIISKEDMLSGNCAFRKVIFDKYCDKYPGETQNIWEDWQIWLQLITKGCVPVHIRQPLFWYRRPDMGESDKINDSSMSKSELCKRAEQLAWNIPDGVEAITFPEKEIKDFAHPVKFDFDEQRYTTKSSKKRILFLLPYVVKGGADLFNIEVAKHINRENFEISVITTRFDRNDIEWMQLLREYCADIFVLKDFLAFTDWPGFIRYYIRTRNVDIVWNLNSFYGYYLFPWLRAEFKDLALANYVHADSAFWRSGGYARLSVAFQEISEVTIASNKLTFETLVKKYNMQREHCRVSYIGADTDYYVSGKVPFGLIRNKLHLHNERPVVLFLCRISPEKRPFLMLEIAEQLIKKLPEACFLVVGEGVMFEQVVSESKLRNLCDNIVFVGEQYDIRPYYRDSNVLLICSLKEGVTQTTFEAMAMGLPVVSADVGGQSELVNKSTGRLIPCLQDEEKDLHNYRYDQEEVQNYADALFEILTNNALCTAMGENNHKLIVENYSTIKATRDFEKFTDELLLSDQRQVDRNHLNRALNEIPHLCEEFVTLYGAYERLERSANEIWEAKVYFQKLADNFATKESQLQMFHWYTKFLTDTIFGRFCWKTMKKIYQLFNRNK